MYTKQRKASAKAILEHPLYDCIKFSDGSFNHHLTLRDVLADLMLMVGADEFSNAVVNAKMHYDFEASQGASHE